MIETTASSSIDPAGGGRLRGRQKPSRPYSRHGLNALMVRVNLHGFRAIDRRTAAARVLLGWKSDLLRDLGGADALSAQELALVDTAVRTKIFLDHVDSWLVAQPSLITKRRALVSVLKERTALADCLSRTLSQLGLKRQAKDLGPSLADLRAQEGVPQ